MIFRCDDIKFNIIMGIHDRFSSDKFKYYELIKAYLCNKLEYFCYLHLGICPPWNFNQHIIYFLIAVNEKGNVVQR